MNKKTLLFLFIVQFHFVWGGDTLVTFHTSKITIPKGYKEFSKEQITEFRATVLNRKIMTVFENKKKEVRKILFYYDSISKTTNLSFDKFVEIKLEVLKENGITFNVIKIDAKNHYFYGKSILLDGSFILIGFSIDSFGIMGIEFDSALEISNAEKLNFGELMKSIKHVNPYKYLPEESKEVKEARKDMESSGMTLTYGLILMIIVWLIRKLIKNQQAPIIK